MRKAASTSYIRMTAKRSPRFPRASPGTLGKHCSWQPISSRSFRGMIVRGYCSGRRKSCMAAGTRLSNTLTLELGISKKDSLYEVGRACDVFNLAGQLCILDDGEIFSCDITPGGKSRKIFTMREPLRAISAITPFNHPLNMVAHKIAPSVATNNCLVCKQTELTPLSALALADILYEAGLPPEMFSVVTGHPEEIGPEMIANPNIELITFTGSVPVGKMIADRAGYIADCA